MPLADRLADVDVVVQPADTHHVPALLIVGIGVEDIVGNVFQHGFQELAGELQAIDRRICDGGLVVDIVQGDVLSRNQRGAPAETGRQRDLRVALLQQGVADQVVEGAVEIAPAVEQRIRPPDNLIRHRPVRRAQPVQHRFHLRIRRDGVAEQGNQPVAEGRDLAVLHVEVEPRQEFTVGAGSDEQGIPDPHRLRQRIVGMAGQDDIDAVDARRQLAVDIEAVVAQQHDEVGLASRRRDRLAHILFSDTERPVFHQVARIGDRRERKGLADHGDAHAAALEIFRAVEDALVPFRVAHIAGQERKFQFLLDDLFHPVGAVGEFPMRRHDIDTKRVHGADHAAAAGLERDVVALPGIAAVEQQRPARPFGADGVDGRRHAVEPAQPPVGTGQLGEIDAGQGIGFGAARLQPVFVQERRAGDVRRQPLDRADAQIDRRFAKIERRKLGVNVGEMQQGHLPYRLEGQQPILRQFLLRSQPANGTGPGDQGSRGAGRREVPAGDHFAALP